MLRVGTRGSALALAQTSLVVAGLERLGLRVEVVPIRTLGDRHPDRPTRALGAGAFVKDLEVALVEGRVDVAVHSAKDLHHGGTPGLTLAAFLPRGDPRDVLVTRDGQGLAGLRNGAVVGTGSPRRRAFLLAARADLVVRDMRGNVDTRLRKLVAGEVDAMVLAAVGLERLGLADRIAERLDPSVMLPAVGQGAIVAQARADGGVAARLAVLDHPPTRAAVEAERALVAGLGGGCESALAAFGTVSGETLALEAAVLAPDGAEIIRDQARGPVADPAGLGHRLAAALRARGADRLLVGVAP
jgi:hydroxymethylbilane synthase